MDLRTPAGGRAGKSSPSTYHKIASDIDGPDGTPTIGIRGWRRIEPRYGRRRKREGHL